MKCLTWLDGYAVAAAAIIREALPDFDGSDAQGAGLLALMSAARLDPAAAVGRGARLDAELAQLEFWTALMVFCPPPDRNRIAAAFRAAGSTDRLFEGGRGLKLSSRLVRAFAHARAPMTGEWREMALAENWYFDLPHEALMIGERQVRAVLTCARTAASAVAVAVLTEPGRDEMLGRYAWMLIGDEERPTGSAADEAGEVRAELQQRATDFIALSLLYFRTLDNTETLPRQPPVTGLSKVQRKLQRATKSLFVVHVLPEPTGNFGRPVGSGEGAWKLDHRVAVRGHFRWQPCGPRHERRELRWIDEHLRGAALLEKPALTPLRKPHIRK